MLDYCLDIGLQDSTLVQTALLLVAFEFQPHIHQNLARATAALGYMETCSRVCATVWAQSGLTSRKDSAPHQKASSATQTICHEELRRMRCAQASSQQIPPSGGTCLTSPPSNSPLPTLPR